MSDLNQEALSIWNGFKPMIDQEIDERTKGMVQRRKAKVTTAPSLVTNTIGVTEPFGHEMFLPFVTNLISASVGDVVWVEWMYEATNAFVSSFASADKKDFSIAGALDVVQRRCNANLSSAGWYRAFSFDYTSGSAVDLFIGVNTATTHKITLMFPSVAYAKFADEISDGPTTVFDKIRFWADSTLNKCYVDVHFNENSSRYVSINAQPYGAFLTSIASMGLESVADSPTGTELALYAFAANGNNAFKTIGVSNTTTSGAFSVTEASVNANSRCIATPQYFSATPTTAWFVMLQPVAGSLNVYIRDASGNIPADGTRIDLDILIDNR